MALLYQGFIQEIEGQVLGHYHDLQRWIAILRSNSLRRPTYLVTITFNGQQLIIDDLDSTMSGCLITSAFTQQAARSKAYDPLIEVARHTYGQMQLLAQSPICLWLRGLDHYQYRKAT